MGFQQNVYITQAQGRAGTLARNTPAKHLPYVVEGNALYAGAFAFAGTAEGQVKGIGASQEAPLGIAIFARYQPNASLSNSLLINEGEEVAVYTEGHIFVNTGSASAGDKVLVEATTGAISAAASASGTLVDTGWVVVSDSDVNGIAEVCK